MLANIDYVLQGSSAKMPAFFADIPFVGPMIYAAFPKPNDGVCPALAESILKAQLPSSVVKVEELMGVGHLDFIFNKKTIAAVVDRVVAEVSAKNPER